MVSQDVVSLVFTPSVTIGATWSVDDSKYFCEV